MNKTKPKINFLYILTIVGLITGYTFLIWSSFSSSPLYNLLNLVAGAVILVSVLPILYQGIQGKELTKKAHLVASVTGGVIVAILALIVFGLVQDLFGAVCQGLMGATMQCVASWWLWVSFIVFSPWVLVPLSVVVAYCSRRAVEK